MDCCSVQQEAMRRPELQVGLPAPPMLRDGANLKPAATDPTDKSFLVNGASEPRLASKESHFQFNGTADAEAKLSSERALSLLDKILEEHSNLRNLIQLQHETMSQRMTDMQASLASSKSCKLASRIPPQPSTPSDAFITNATLGSGGSSNAPVGELAGAAAAAAKEVAPSTAHTEPAEVPLLERILYSIFFEVLMAVVILINTCTMFISLQMQGLHEGWKLGLRDDDADWDTHSTRFVLIENLFNSMYLVELIMRICVQGRSFPRHFTNVMDSLIVGFSCIDSYVLQPLSIQAINISVLRLVRLSRVFRAAKFLRFSENLSELRVLVHTLYYALRGIAWSILLLTGVILAGGILMTQLVINFLGSETIDMQTRIWMYNSFGTTMVSIMTIFECTFTGVWPSYSRRLVLEVSYSFAFFWVVWVLMVNFMTMKVVGALFLKQTMAVAAHDDEKIAMDQLKRRGELADNLRKIFQAADSSGDGCIGKKEFSKMITHKHVVEEFAMLGLDLDEVNALFSVLTADDGSADYEEFINGALAMNSSSATLDSLKSLTNQLKMKSDLDLVVHIVQPMGKTIESLIEA